MKLSEFKPSYSNIIFSESMASVKSVTDNGGTITGTPVINNYGVFNGTTDKIGYTNIDWSKVGSFSATGEVSEIDTTDNICVFSGSNASTSPMLRIVAGGANISFWSNVSLASISYGLTGSPTSFKWGITFNNTTNQVTFYLNGAQVGQNTMAGGLSTTSNTLQIGARAGLDWFKGRQRNFVIHKGVLTPEEIKDIHEKDTYAELERAVIDLPLRSWYYKDNGVELLTDGDMEAGDVSAWTLTGVTATKETGTRTGGSGSQVLRLVRTGGTACASQAITAPGKWYRITGWARSYDGVAAPNVYAPLGTPIWYGTTSTNWQYFDVTFIGGAGNTIGLYAGLTNGYATEWDDVTVELMEAQTENKGSLGGVAYLGDKSTATTFPTQLSPHGNRTDGGDYLDLGTSPIGNTNLPFTVGGLFTLVPGAYHPLISCSQGTSAGFELRTEAGVVYLYIWSSSGNYKGVYTGANYLNGKHTIFATYDGSLGTAGMKVYVDGEAISTSASSAGSLIATAISNNLFVGKNVASNYAGSGIEWREPFVFDYVITPSQAKILHHDLMAQLNN